MIAALCLGPLTAQAKIGDDIVALRGAYGSAKAVGNQMLFQHDGFSISVFFDGSRSAMEIFARDDSKPGVTEFTQADIDKILAMEGDGMPWSEIQTHSGKPTWLSGDRKMIARFNADEKILAIMLNEK